MATNNGAHEGLIRDIFIVYGRDDRWRIWKNNTGTAYREGHMIRYGLKGSADIFGIARGGRFIALEIKTGTGKQTKDQLSFEKMITSFGGLYNVVRTLDDVADVIQKI